MGVNRTLRDTVLQYVLYSFAGSSFFSICVCESVSVSCSSFSGNGTARGFFPEEEEEKTGGGQRKEWRRAEGKERRSRGGNEKGLNVSEFTNFCQGSRPRCKASKCKKRGYYEWIQLSG